VIVYADTSAIYAIFDGDDVNHSAAKGEWQRLLSGEATIICSNYVMVEAFALIQGRLGLEALKCFQDDVSPMLSMQWIDRESHEAAVAAVLTANRRELSLVDCSSFYLMRKMSIKKAFAFDKHFREQGFEVLPGGDR
jgi:uncharacterized protein